LLAISGILKLLPKLGERAGVMSVSHPLQALRFGYPLQYRKVLRLEAGSAKVRAPQARIAQVRVAQVGAIQVRAAQDRAFQVRSVQERVAQVRRG
jgi:hypothetical protein